MYLNQPNMSKILYFSITIPQASAEHSPLAFSVITFSSWPEIIAWFPGQERDRKKSFAKRWVSRASESFARLGVRRLVLFVYESARRLKLLCLDAAAAGSSIHVLYSDLFPL